MDIAIVGIATLTALAVIVVWILRKVFAPKKKRFPTCRHCGRYMAPQSFSKGETPYEMVAYLYKWQLPDLVIRKHVCPLYHSELWIAPPVGDMEKSLFVSRRL
jgi:hypothetical protein